MLPLKIKVFALSKKYLSPLTSKQSPGNHRKKEQFCSQLNQITWKLGTSAFPTNSKRCFRVERQEEPGASKSTNLMVPCVHACMCVRNRSSGITPFTTCTHMHFTGQAIISNTASPNWLISSVFPLLSTPSHHTLAASKLAPWSTVTRPI